MICPLCYNSNSKESIHQLKGRDFFLCGECDLVFADPDKLVTGNDEKSRYLTHQNSERSEGYVTFLSKVMNPLKDFISKDSTGLDYGSGPYPMLKELMEEDGYTVEAYDPFFNPIALKAKYDYIVSTEVIEHFHYPKKDFDRITDLLKEGAVLALMTGIRYPEINFKTWHYIQDDTHISLYSPKTMRWISENYNLEVIYEARNVYFLKTRG